MENSREQSDYWVNITKIVNFFRHTRESGFLFCACNNQRMIREINRQIIENAKQHELTVGEVYVSYDDIDNILSVLRKGVQESPKGIILNNMDELIERTDGRFITDINMGREILIEMSVPMVFWLSEEHISRFANQATDLFNRRDRSVVFFSDLPGVPASMERLDEFYELGFKSTEDYSSLKLKIGLMEKQLQEARKKNVSEERIAKEIAADLIELYLEASLYPEAYQLFEEYRSYYENVSNIRFINLCGRVYNNTGDWDKASAYFLKSEQIYLEIGNKIGLGETYNNIGRIYDKKGQWDKALIYHLKSEQICLEVGDHHGLGRSYNNIGFIYYNKGQWSKSLTYYLKSEKIRIEVGDKAGLGYTYNNIGKIYDKKGQWDEALIYYLKAEQIEIEVGNRAELGPTYNYIGFTYSNKGELEKALEYFLKAEHIRIEVGDRAGLSWTYNGIGRVYHRQGDWNKALTYFLKSVQISLEVGDHEGLGWTYNNIGEIYSNKGDKDEALTCFLKSKQILIEVGDRARLSYTYFNIGRLFQEKNDKQKANPYLILAGYLAKTLGMNHKLSEWSWALNPLIEKMGEERFMEEGKRLLEERGIF